MTEQMDSLWQKRVDFGEKVISRFLGPSSIHPKRQKMCFPPLLIFDPVHAPVRSALGQSPSLDLGRPLCVWSLVLEGRSSNEKKTLPVSDGPPRLRPNQFNEYIHSFPASQHWTPTSGKGRVTLEEEAGCPVGGPAQAVVLGGCGAPRNNPSFVELPMAP